MFMVQRSINDIRKEVSDCLEQIQNHSADLGRFIDYILENHPYDGYDINNRSDEYNWDNADRDIYLLEFLKRKYNPDSYHRRTREEKKNYYIRVKI